MKSHIDKHQGWQLDSHKQFMTCLLSQTFANYHKLVPLRTDANWHNCPHHLAAHKPAVVVTISMQIVCV